MQGGTFHTLDNCWMRLFKQFLRGEAADSRSLGRAMLYDVAGLFLDFGGFCFSAQAH